MYEAKAANKNCVRFAADLATSRDPVVPDFISIETEIENLNPA